MNADTTYWSRTTLLPFYERLARFVFNTCPTLPKALQLERILIDATIAIIFSTITKHWTLAALLINQIIFLLWSRVVLKSRPLQTGTRIIFALARTSLLGWI